VVGGYAATSTERCPRGVRGFAGPAENQYYDCRSGDKYAELVTCEDGGIYDRKEVTCTENLLKRGSSEIVQPIIDQVSLGEAIKIGTLYSQRTSQMYHGYELYSKGTLDQFVRKIDGSLREEQKIEAVSSTRESRAKFGLGASLELELMSGLIKVKGSAEYVKDEINKSNRARVILKKEIEGDVFELDKDAAMIDYDYCNMVGENSGPTHFVSRVIMGQRSYMVFDKDAASNTDVETIKGKLEASIDLIPDLVIKGSVAIGLDGHTYYNDDEMRVKFYGDVILEKVPRTWLQAVDTFNTVLEQKDENGNKKLAYSSPIKYSLTPLNEICGDQTAAVIKGITEDLVSKTIDNLDYLTSHREMLNYLLGTDPAIRYSSIREQLLVFKTGLEAFYAKMAARVAKVLPLIKASRVEEGELRNILIDFEDSAFEKARSEDFLTYRKREIETILKIVDDALKNPDMLLSDPVSATDNECIFKQDYGTIFVLNLLPDLGVAQNFIETRDSWSEPESWVGNWRAIRIIGNIKKKFESYVETNVKSLGNENNKKCYMLKLGPLNMDEKYEMYLYKNGKEVTNSFEPPQKPMNAVTCIDTHSDGLTLKVDAADDRYVDVTGIEVKLESYVNNHKSEQIVENESSVRVTDLLPDEVYRVTYRYIVQDGHGFSDYAGSRECRTRPTSGPVALSANQITSNSLKISWAKPENIAAHLKDATITYTVLINEGTYLDRSKAETKPNLDGLSLVLNQKKPGTVYTIAVFPTVKMGSYNGHMGDKAVLTAATAPAAPAAPVPGQVQDNRARFQVKVGDVSVPAGVKKELLSIKYYKVKNGQAVSGTEVYYMQRLQDQENTEIDIASFESGISYGVQVKLLVRYGDRLLGSVYSSQATITTSDNGSPIDNLRDNINLFESSSKQKLDQADSQKNQLISTMNNAEKKFNSAKSGGLQEISNMSDKISLDFVGVQQKSNVLQKSRCLLEGFSIWDYATYTIKTLNVNSVADCLAQCADTDGCSSSSVEYIKSSDNRITSRSCQLRTRRNGYMLFPQKNYVSANMYCQLIESATIDTWKECVQDNTDYNGAGIATSAGISNIEECAAFCQTVEGCVAVTFNKSTKTCYAKSKRNGDRVQSNSSAVSVSLMCLSANRGGVSRCAKNGVKFTGSVIQTTTTASLDLCIQFCSNRNDCESVGYNSSSKRCEAHNKRLGASRVNAGGWTSVNMYCMGLQHF